MATIIRVSISEWLHALGMSICLLADRIYCPPEAELKDDPLDRLCRDIQANDMLARFKNAIYDAELRRPDLPRA